MTAILGFSDILLGNVDKEQSDEAARIIKRNGEYLLSIINDILDLSKIEIGKFEVQKTVCSPAQVVSDVLATMAVCADAKSLDVTMECREDVPSAVCTDPACLRQILMNLVGNAIKFTDHGGVRVVLRREPSPENPAKLLFDIIDTGIGISKEHLAMLFQPFAQADSSMRRRFGGTGLGLAISRRLAEMLGGNIIMSSVLGEGSTFTVSITAELHEAVPFRVPSEISTANSSQSAAHDVHLDCRVLLAEDGPDNQRLLKLILDKAGAEVSLAENGKIAVDLALAAQRQGQPFDIILMDMQMPVMDGYEATRTLRNAGYTNPIIAVTSQAMSEDHGRCIEAGCDDYLTKPITRAELLQSLQLHVVHILEKTNC